MYVWLTQSNFSFLQGASHPDELLKATASRGFQGFCLADFDGVYGMVQAYRAQKTLKEETKEAPQIFYGAQVLLDFGMWNEFKLPTGESYSGNHTDPAFLQNRLVFVACSKAGYFALNQLLTYVHRNGKIPEPLDANDPCVPWPADTLAIFPQRGVSQLFSPLHTSLFERWLKSIQLLQQLHKGSFFLAVTPPSIALEHNAFENHLEAHARLDIPLLATPDVFFHTPERKPFHDLLTSIRRNETLQESLWAQLRNNERTFHSPGYYERFFSKTPTLQKALANNTALAPQVKFCLSELKYQYPQEFVPPGLTSQEFLEQLVRQACQDRYGSHIPKIMEDLVEKELLLVKELTFADYFLTVWDIVRFANSQNILNQGRGSAANSAICFLLNITAVDPTQFDVLFERFISRERGEPPDIDVDFEHERREEVIQYVYTRYGRQRAAMVANVITFQKKGALRSVGKALGLSEKELTSFFSGLVDRIAYARSILEILEEGVQHLSPERQQEVRPVLASWAEYASTLRGFPRHLGIHSGGFVISQESLLQICPIEPATMEGRSVIQWNKDDIEVLGLFKIDILALGMLTALRKSFEYLKNHRKTIPGTLLPINLSHIPQGCEKTYEMIRQAKTTGVFQIESRAQMSMLPRLLPRKFYDLVIEIAIVRPGPIVGKMVHPYLQRRHGKGEITYPDPRLVPILEKTLGVPIFQEQVMRIAIAVGNFTPGEADELRRSMGAWKFKGRINMFEEKLLSGMRANKIPEDFAQQILSQIKGFSEYGFPESHSISFANIAYASSYLKAHFPAYFLCGLLNSQPLGFYSIHSLLQEARHNGVKILQPCVVKSGWDSNVTTEGSVQLGLRIVASIHQENVEKFIRRRTELSQEATFHDYIRTLDVFFSYEQISLAMAGCFHVFESNRRNILWYLLAHPSSLMPDVEYRRFAEKTPLLEAWANLQDDYSHIKTSLGPHALTLIKTMAWPFAFPCSRLTLANNLSHAPQNAPLTVAGLAIVRQSPPTAKGMLFITLEDETGTMNLVLKPHISQKYRPQLIAGDLLCITARRQKNGVESTLLVEEVHGYLPVKKPQTVGQVLTLEQGKPETSQEGMWTLFSDAHN